MCLDIALNRKIFDYQNKTVPNFGQGLIDKKVTEKLPVIAETMKSVVSPVQTFLNSVTDLKQAKKSYLKTYNKMDSTGFEKKLTQYLFAGYLSGRVIAYKPKPKNRSRFYNYSKEDVINKLELLFDKDPETAISFLKSEGIEVSWNWQEQLDIIKHHSFTVAKMTEMDCLLDVKNSLEKAISDGTSLAEYKKTTMSLLEDGGWSTKADGSAWRLDTIYRTNLQSSYQAARQQEQQAAQQYFPYWKYVAVMDNRTREEHAAMNGVTLRSDDPFWLSAYVPNGYNCRCEIVTLSQDDVDKMNVNVLPADKQTIELNGDDIKVSNWKPDTGFETNPSEQWKPDLTNYPPEIRDKLRILLDV